MHFCVLKFTSEIRLVHPYIHMVSGEIQKKEEGNFATALNYK
jgi:hypothetical protein